MSNGRNIIGPTASASNADRRPSRDRAARPPEQLHVLKVAEESERALIGGLVGMLSRRIDRDGEVA